MHRRLAPLLAVAAALTSTTMGCSADRSVLDESGPAESSSRADRTPSDEPDKPYSRAPSTSGTRSPSPRPEPVFDDWVVGAEPLPLRGDGFGQVRPTPPELRVRRMRTPDVLPPPTGERFEAVQRPVTPAFARRTDLAWFPNCPVGLDELRLLELSFWGFDDRPHTGRLVVNASVADDVASVFHDLWDARFPLEEVRLVTRADLDAPPTGDGNTTAAYACRPITGSAGWSAHAYGLAVDVNPFMNPYKNGDLVLPELASAYLDRDWRRPGMIFADGPVVRAFDRVGWTWGGTFRSVLDLHHFSANGR